jgi:hypothetical protein
MQVQVPVWRLKLPDFDLECLGNLMLHESLHGLYKPAEWLHHDVTDAGEDGGSSAAAGFTARPRRNFQCMDSEKEVPFFSSSHQAHSSISNVKMSNNYQHHDLLILLSDVEIIEMNNPSPNNLLVV